MRIFKLLLIIFLIVSCQSKSITIEKYNDNLNNRFYLDISHIVNIDDKSKSIIKDQSLFNQMIKSYNSDSRIIVCLRHSDRFKITHLFEQSEEFKKELPINREIYFLYDVELNLGSSKKMRVVITDNKTYKKLLKYQPKAFDNGLSGSVSN